MHSGYILLTVLTILNVVFAGYEVLLSASAKCFTKTGTSQDALDEVLQKRPMATDDSKIKCYLQCVLESISWMDDMGNILERPAKPDTGITEEEINDAAQCLNVTGINFCDKAFNFIKCVEENKLSD